MTEKRRRQKMLSFRVTTKEFEVLKVEAAERSMGEVIRHRLFGHLKPRLAPYGGSATGYDAFPRVCKCGVHWKGAVQCNGCGDYLDERAFRTALNEV